MKSTDDTIDPSEFDIRLLDKGDCVVWQPPLVSSGMDSTSASVDEIAACFEDARQRGLAEGRAQGEAEFRLRTQQLAELITALSQPLSGIDATVERELSELAVLIGQQLCKQQLLVQPEQVLAIVHEAIDRLPVAKHPVRIRLNPDDAALIASSGEQEPGWQLIEDPGMARGGCEIQTDSSRIDASLETRLAELVAQLFGEQTRIES